MKVVILAGGLGTRLSEYTKKIPKPMVKIGNIPIIHHIIKLYMKYGFDDFIIAGGYKFELIKNYFNKSFIKKININVVDTGLNSLTAKRLFLLKKFLNKKTFMLTYGDGLSDLDIDRLYNFHKKNKKLITITAVHPQARFGELELRNKIVKKFVEKPQLQTGWINGGFFVIEPDFFKFITNRNEMLEREPIQRAVKKELVAAYKHEGFWYCMDNLRDKQVLEKIYKKNKNIWAQ